VNLNEGTLLEVTQSLWRGRLVSPTTNGNLLVIHIGAELMEILAFR